MPEKLRFEPPDTLSSQDFTFRENKEMSAVQANETFVVDAGSNRPLGENGETMGFAKKQFSNDTSLQDKRERAYIRGEEKKAELLNKPWVKQWEADRHTLENIDQQLEAAAENLSVQRMKLQEELNKAQKELNKPLQDTGVPVGEVQGELNAKPSNADDIKRAERNVEVATKDLAALQAVKDNRVLEKARLAELFKVNPDIRAYLQAKEKMLGVASIKDSIGGVTESSAQLYENRSRMNSPDSGGDRQLLSRAVASREVDKLIGLNVCAQEKFGLDPDGGVMGISIQCNGAGVRSQHGENEYGEKTTAFLTANYADENIQRGINDLEALDYITGQTDRHPGNIFVDTDTGKVTGIDNDLAFPEVEREEMIEREPLLAGKVVAGMPRMMHEDTAAKIMAIKPDALEAKLKSVLPPDRSPGLGDKEIQGAVKRLKAMQSALKEGGIIEVVPKFTQDTYDRAVKLQRDSGMAKCTSYIGAVEKERIEVENAIKAGNTKFAWRACAPGEAIKAKLNPEYAAFLKMDKERQADYRGLQRSLDKVDDKLEAANKQRGKLDHPKLKDRLASLRHGGIEGEKRHLDKKIASLKAERTGLEHRIDQFKNEQAIPLAERAQQSKQEQDQQEPKKNVGEALRQQSAVKAPAADKHSAGDNKVGAQMGKRPALKVGSTSSSSIRH